MPDTRLYATEPPEWKEYDQYSSVINQMHHQRALVLQGGGSLGAYEAGAYEALYERISKTDREKGENDKPFLNIVSGTSIGAINAAIIVSYVVENGMGWLCRKT